MSATPNAQQESVTTASNAQKLKQNKAAKSKDEVPRGLPKSRRPWKTPKQKFTTVKKTVNRLSYAKKMELRNELRHIKEVSKELKEQRKQQAVEKNQRRIENAERRLANERRAEVVQIIKNPAKLKRMKKKQMRLVEKRDLSKVKTA